MEEKIYLLNSAVVTTPGSYRYKYISVEEFKKLLSAGVQSYIGYEETTEAIKILTGVVVPTNRGTIRMYKGDKAVIFRLTSRVADPTKKGEVGVEEILNNCEIGLLEKLAD